MESTIAPNPSLLSVWAWNMVGGRDSPHGVFDPWARWDLGLVRVRSFHVVVVVVVTAGFSTNYHYIAIWLLSYIALYLINLI